MNKVVMIEQGESCGGVRFYVKKSEDFTTIERAQELKREWGGNVKITPSANIVGSLSQIEDNGLLEEI